MKERIVVVGSGPSGVQFALTVLRKGHEVTLLDVGFPKPEEIRPEDSFNALKRNLSDPVSYFYGEDYRGILLPGPKKEFYGIPPGKDYVFRPPSGFSYESRGFSPLFSFAQGGLAETWTGGCYPFNEAELEDFPFDYCALAPAYAEVARRIGISGARDDLARFLPFHDGILEPLELDTHSARLLDEYEKRKQDLNARLGCYLGRTRVAALSRDLGGRPRCTNLGRCLWGCPTAAFYTPSLTLAECRTFPNFHYAPGLRVSHFKFDAGRHVTHVVAVPAAGGEPQEFPAGTLVLAAGALASSKIYLDSIYFATGEIVALRGLMDNRQVLVPFVNLHLLGKQFNPDSYQYHQLGLGIESPRAREYVHGQITTLKTGLLHPIIQNLPCDMKTATVLVRNLHCALGIVNVNFHDTRRDDNLVTLERDAPGGGTRLVIRYAPAAEQAAYLNGRIGMVKKALRRLGCVVPPGMVYVRPMGASAHYAGTLPMSREKREHATTPECRSQEFENLFLVDGATFPFLPAKNITFTLMANAVRVAEAAF